MVPSVAPSAAPSQVPSQAPSHAPSKAPTNLVITRRLAATSTACVKKQNEFACVGRGYPDLAVLGNKYLIVNNNMTVAVSGTSASTPVVAGMISLVNAARLKVGKSSLGWLNPALYAHYTEFVNDITVGENNCAAGGEVCCGAGYNAAAGWDPVTGLGSVNFTSFSRVLTALGSNLNVPTTHPTPGLNEPSFSPTPVPSATPSVTPGTATREQGWFTVSLHDSAGCTDNSLTYVSSTKTNECNNEVDNNGNYVTSSIYTCGEHGK